MVKTSIILHGGSGEQVRDYQRMAQLRLEPPEPFNFRTPDDWPRWKRRFEQFRIASGLAGSAAAQQINTFLYCIGEEAEAVLTSTNVTEDERKVYDTVVTKFDGFFKVRRNVIFECARFNRRYQHEGETAEQYIMELYRLAENCDYGGLKDEMIRDRLVVGIRDTALSQQLQLNAELTLDKAKTKVRQREAVGEQQRELKGASEGAISLEKIRFRKHFKSKRPQALVPEKKIETLKLSRRRAPAAGRNRTPVTNAQRKIRPVIAATKRGTTARSILAKDSRKSRRKTH